MLRNYLINSKTGNPPFQNNSPKTILDSSRLYPLLLFTSQFTDKRQKEVVENTLYSHINRGIIEFVGGGGGETAWLNLNNLRVDGRRVAADPPGLGLAWRCHCVKYCKWASLSFLALAESCVAYVTDLRGNHSRHHSGLIITCFQKPIEI